MRPNVLQSSRRRSQAQWCLPPQGHKRPAEASDRNTTTHTMGLPSDPYRESWLDNVLPTQGGGCRINPLGPSIYSIVGGIIAIVGRESMLLCVDLTNIFCWRCLLTGSMVGVSETSIRLLTVKALLTSVDGRRPCVGATRRDDSPAAITACGSK
jgi:hypothetical protein